MTSPCDVTSGSRDGDWSPGVQSPEVDVATKWFPMYRHVSINHSDLDIGQVNQSL